MKYKTPEESKAFASVTQQPICGNDLTYKYTFTQSHSLTQVLSSVIHFLRTKYKSAVASESCYV